MHRCCRPQQPHTCCQEPHLSPSLSMPFSLPGTPFPLIGVCQNECCCTNGRKSLHVSCAFRWFDGNLWCSFLGLEMSLISAFLFTWSSSHVSVPKFSLFMVYQVRGPPYFRVISSSPILSTTTLFHKVYILRYWVVGLQHELGFGWRQNSPCDTILTSQTTASFKFISRFQGRSQSLFSEFTSHLH
jgi:hypothetical protein